MLRVASCRASSSSPEMRRFSSEVMTSAATFLPAKVTPLASGDRHDEVNLGLSATTLAAKITTIAPVNRCLRTSERLLHGQVDAVRSLLAEAHVETQIRARAFVQEQPQSAAAA